MTNSTSNILYLTDSYKVGHWKQYPPGTTLVFEYFESRGGKYPETALFGLQYILKNYLAGRVAPDLDAINAARAFYATHLGSDIFNIEGWKHIRSHHDGRLPVEIRAVPEGSVWPTHTTLFTVENTCPECYWVPGWIETLLVQCWYGTTVATQSRGAKKTINGYLEQSGDPAGLPFKLHDFGFRGVSSVESASIGGAAHLVNFRGTDTVAGIRFVQDYYSPEQASVEGFSIPAAEHSTITSWGKEHEVDAFRNMLDQFPDGAVAVVSDSFDIHHAVSQYWGKDLRERVLARNGTVVVRPDSGDPVDTVCRVIAGLVEAYGAPLNAKGFKVLPPQIRVIQGDGINLVSIDAILDAMRWCQFSADNITFGMGGALLQKVDRDIENFALKCSLIEVNGVERPVWKMPLGDQMKASRAGRQDHPGLVPVFRDGEVLKEYYWHEVRKNAEI